MNALFTSKEHHDYYARWFSLFVDSWFEQDFNLKSHAVAKLWLIYKNKQKTFE